MKVTVYQWETFHKQNFTSVLSHSLLSLSWFLCFHSRNFRSCLDPLLLFSLKNNRSDGWFCIVSDCFRILVVSCWWQVLLSDLWQISLFVAFYHSFYWKWHVYVRARVYFMTSFNRVGVKVGGEQLSKKGSVIGTGRVHLSVKAVPLNTTIEKKWQKNVYFYCFDWTRILNQFFIYSSCLYANFSFLILRLIPTSYLCVIWGFRTVI